MQNYNMPTQTETLNAGYANEREKRSVSQRQKQFLQVKYKIQWGDSMRFLNLLTSAEKFMFLFSTDENIFTFLNLIVDEKMDPRCRYLRWWRKGMRLESAQKILPLAYLICSLSKLIKIVFVCMNFQVLSDFSNRKECAVYLGISEATVR